MIPRSNTCPPFSRTGQPQSVPAESTSKPTIKFSKRAKQVFANIVKKRQDIAFSNKTPEMTKDKLKRWTLGRASSLGKAFIGLSFAFMQVGKIALRALISATPFKSKSKRAKHWTFHGAANDIRFLRSTLSGSITSLWSTFAAPKRGNISLSDNIAALFCCTFFDTHQKPFDEQLMKLEAARASN